MKQKKKLSSKKTVERKRILKNDSNFNESKIAF